MSAGRRLHQEDVVFLPAGNAVAEKHCIRSSAEGKKTREVAVGGKTRLIWTVSHVDRAPIREHPLNQVPYAIMGPRIIEYENFNVTVSCDMLSAS